MHSGGNWNEWEIGVVPAVPRLKVLMILFLAVSVEMELWEKQAVDEPSWLRTCLILSIELSGLVRGVMQLRGSFAG